MSPLHGPSDPSNNQLQDNLESDLTRRPKERRHARADRRSNTRQGKFDRRRNRCAQCLYFENKPLLDSFDDLNGFCTKHQEAITSQTYACWVFEPTSV
jgi:hypothetical protein